MSKVDEMSLYSARNKRLLRLNDKNRYWDLRRDGLPGALHDRIAPG